MKKTRTMLCFLLLLSMLLSVTAYASVGTNIELYPASSGAIYWIDNPALFESFLLQQTSVNDVQNFSTHTLSTKKTSNLLRATNIPTNYTYTFDVDGSGPVAAITVIGDMEEITLDELTFKTGTLKGQTTINDIDCKVSAVVQMEVDGSRVFAGITIIPENAISLDDYIFFAMGDPFITADMLPAWVTSNDDRSSQLDTLSTSNSTRTSDANNSNYVSKVTHFSSFSANNHDITGLSQRLSVHVDERYNRVCLAVKSYTRTIEQHFSNYYSAQTIVDDLKIGLRSDPSQGPAILNIHNLPLNTYDASSVIDNAFIDHLITLLSDVYEIASSYLIPFEILFNTFKSNNKLTVTTLQTGTHSYALFDFSAPLN